MTATSRDWYSQSNAVQEVSNTRPTVQLQFLWLVKRGSSDPYIAHSGDAIEAYLFAY